MNELWDSLGDLGQLAVSLGTVVAVFGLLKLTFWALEKFDD